jgi:hypothetical protein
MGCGHATDVVLCGLAAEKNDNVNALCRSHENTVLAINGCGCVKKFLW